MRAKFVYEQIENILRPKSEEEIMSHLEDLSPDELLLKSLKIGFLPIVRLALEKGADIHARNDYALRYASEDGHKDVAELLLKNGADVHADNDDALQGAAASGHKDIVELLLKNGADAHADNDFAFQLALNREQKNIIKLLKKYM